MICKKYENLTIIEKVQMVGKLLHAMQSSNELFDKAKWIIEVAELQGMFDKVTILPNDNKDYYDEKDI